MDGRDTPAGKSIIDRDAEADKLEPDDEVVQMDEKIKMYPDDGIIERDADVTAVEAVLYPPAKDSVATKSEQIKQWS